MRRDRVWALGLLALLLAGCARERSKATEPAGAPSMPAAEQPAPPPAPAPAADQGLEEEAEPMEREEAPASGAAPSRSLPQDERALKGQSEDLDRALKLDARDCQSAGRHKEAICDIAKRICTLLDDGSYRAGTEDPKRACDSARERCQKAGARYAEACE